MTRRTLFTALLTAMSGAVAAVSARSVKLRRFRIRLKTRGGSIIGTTIEARDQFEAVAKAQKRYPGCTILSVQPE